MLNLEKELTTTSRLGTSLGQDAYKIRLKISGKGKGKSGGARVISFVKTIVVGVAKKISAEEVIVNLLIIYAKADVDNIADKELKELIRNIKAK